MEGGVGQVWDPSTVVRLRLLDERNTQIYP